MSFLKSLFGDTNEKTLAKMRPLVAEINSLESGFAALSDEALKNKTAEFKERIAKGETLDEILPEAFAAVREAAKRTLGQRHYDVQLLGGMILHLGEIAEMRTGEGKTLVATLPVYLNSLTGKGVHVVTVNDYLARRDAVWMGQVYNALGLSVGVLNHDTSYLYDPLHSESQISNLKSQNLDKARDETGGFKVVHEFLRPATKKDAYAADVTYGTNNEFGFDYLRDNLAYRSEGLSQRDYNFAVVDEIDSILIDESRTPLIISAPSRESEELYVTFSKIAEKMEKGEDYTVDEKLRAVTMSDAGITKAEKLLGIENIYTEKGIKYVHHLETAVRAKAIFHKDKDYVVKNDEVVIVDEFTGRLQPGRRWSEGLHQAIEAKEGVTIQKESRTMASITFQNYFKLYGKLSGMTGTAKTSSEEFYKVYGLEVVSVPPNKSSERADRNDLIFQTEEGKFKAIARKVKELNQKGQPVLIGTVSIEKNELLSAYLSREGVGHEVLNAKNHEREGEIIAQAGKRGSVVIATNMAGRGVDIKLGGNPATPSEYEEVKNLGGLFVLGTERHEARRIDNQLRGRSGRQGDSGETQFFVSLEDSLMRVFASDAIKKMMGRFGIPEDEPIENKMITRALESAQEKIEGFNFDARKHLLEYDTVLNHQRRIVYERRRKILLGGKAEVKEFLGKLEGFLGEENAKMIENKEKEIGEEKFYAVLRQMVLQVSDMLWVEHLEAMDYLRGSVNLRAYGQRDPLVEYRKEGLRMFKDMEASLAGHIFGLLPNIQAGGFREEKEELKEVHENTSLIGGSSGNSSAPALKPKKPDGTVVGRNDPCPCGSGKKYKKCHGA